MWDAEKEDVALRAVSELVDEIGEEIDDNYYDYYTDAQLEEGHIQENTERGADTSVWGNKREIEDKREVEGQEEESKNFHWDEADFLDDVEHQETEGRFSKERISPLLTDYEGIKERQRNRNLLRQGERSHRYDFVSREYEEQKRMREQEQEHVEKLLPLKKVCLPDCCLSLH